MVSRALDRVRLLIAGENGTVLPLVAVTVVVMIGCSAFSVDISNYSRMQRQLQNAADAAALAGASDLPTSTTGASSDASTYAADNITGARTTVTVPYDGSSDTIHVTVSETVSGIFGSVFGVNSETVTASATASANSGSSPSAFFADNTTCGSTNGIYISGDTNTFTGGEHSNGSFNVPGTGNALGSGATYGGPNACTDSIASGNTGSAPTVDPNTEAWPWDPRSDLPACTYSAASFDWSTSNASIPSGVYCATSSITVSGDDVSGSVTFIAPTIKLTGSGLALTAYWDNLWIYDDGTGTLKLSGSYIDSDTVFAPNATVSVTGSSSTNVGFVEAENITVTGAGWNFTGNGPPVGGSGGVALTD